MRAKSEEWSSLASGQFALETKARIGGVDYTAISAPKIDRASMDSDLSVGNCFTATLSLSIMTDDIIPATAPIVIMSRLTDGTTYSEWKEFGTFYINTRDTSHRGLLSLECYDSMLKANQDYVTEFETEVSYPKPMKTIVQDIATRLGVAIDPRTKIKTGADYVISYPSGLTMMQVLGYIGACHGGNWVITEDNLLRLIPLVPYTGDTPTSTVPITRNIIDETGANIVSEDGDNIVWALSNTPDAVDGTVNVPVVCGELVTGKAMTVSGVVMKDDTGNVYSAGDDTGAVLNIEGNPYATQSICDDLFDVLDGFEYYPYTATKTVYDPAAELGDQVEIGDVVSSVLCHTTLTLDIGFWSDISAPGSDEQESEYPFLSEKKQLEVAINKVKHQNEVNFQINAEGIAAEVTRAQGAEGALSSRITQNADNINLKVSKGDVVSEINLSNDVISLESGRLLINSGNFKLRGHGSATATGFHSNRLTVEGLIKCLPQPSATNDNSESRLYSNLLEFYDGDTILSRLDNNDLAFYDNGTVVGALRSKTAVSGSHSAVKLETDNDGIIFSVGNTYYFALNNGLNPDNFSERFVAMCTSRFRDDMYLGSRLMFEHPTQGTNRFFMSNSTICSAGSMHVEGDLTVIGSKNRAVRTDNYGHLALNAMESATAVFSDMGSGIIDETGICEIVFDPRFAETIDSRSEYIVFITQTGPGAISYTNKTPGVFTVNGTAGTRFDWIVFAKQKNYANTYLDTVDVPEPQEELTNTYLDTVYAPEPNNELTDDSIFMDDDTASVNTENYMCEFEDTYDEQALQYLETYEKELMYYGN